MSYTILNRREQVTVVTTVEYIIDGQSVVVDVSHFMPSSEDDIVLGIQNREVSERERIQNENNI